MKPYTLRLYSPISDPSPAFVADLTNAAPNWRRSHRSMGGPWQGSFTLQGSAAQLQHAFDTWLGFRLVERVAGLATWEGQIYELELTGHAMRRVRSLDLLANAARVQYITWAWTGTRWESSEFLTPWLADAASVARYGRKEQTLTTSCPLATAELIRNTLIRTNAWPWPRPIGSTSDPALSLQVRVCGYVYTANWMFAHEYDYTDHNVSDWITSLVGTTFGLTLNHGGASATAGDCQFLRTGRIQANTLQVTEAVTAQTRTWSLLSSLAGLGDASAIPWTLQVQPGRTVDYRPLSTTPRYYLRNGALYDKLAAPQPVTPWKLKPGVIRDMTYPGTRAEPGSFLTDVRDSYVEEIEVTAEGNVILKTALYNQADLLSAQLNYISRARTGGIIRR